MDLIEVILVCIGISSLAMLATLLFAFLLLKSNDRDYKALLDRLEDLEGHKEARR